MSSSRFHTVLKSFYLFLLLFIPACSGGGSGSIATPENALTGQFLDGPVSGLDFSTFSWSYITDQNGTFSYQPEEEITFSVGGVILGTTQAKAIITPIDLVPGAAAEADPASNPTVINICRFLLSLDKDNDPDNGIEISEDTRNILAGFSFNFNDPLDDNPDVQRLFEMLNEVGIFPEDVDGGQRTLISEEAARLHFEKTLDKIRQQQAEAEDIELSAIITKPSANVLLVQGQSIPFEVSVIGGTAPYTYEWILRNTEIIHQAASPPYSINTLAPGNYTLSFAATDVDGITDGHQVLVTVLDSALYGSIPGNDEPMEVIFADSSGTGATIARGETLNIHAVIKKGNPPFYYSWSYPETVTYSYEDNPLDAVFSFSSTGRQTIRLTMKDSLNSDYWCADIVVIVQ